MRTRSTLAGLVVVVMLGGLASPVAANGEHDGETGEASTETTTEVAAQAPDDAPPPTDGSTDATDTGDGDGDSGSGEPTGGGEPATPPDDGGDGESDGGTPPGEPAGEPADDPATGTPPAPADDDPPAPPTVTNTQDATADATSHAVADSGGNTAVNGTVQVIVAEQNATAGDATGGNGDGTPATSPTAGNDADTSNSGVGLALVVTGGASATGGATTDTISQKALVKAVGTGEIEIIQIALIVNLGVGVANTGGNDATGLDVVNVIGIGQGAGAGPGGAGAVATNGLTAANDATGVGGISTGDATAVGNAETVTVTQAANAAAGSGVVTSDQLADIASLGVAYGNTGLNIVIGNTVIQLVLVGQGAGAGAPGTSASASNSATAGNSATGLAAITTGQAGAVGNASTTGIAQLATADAGDGGFVSILQRAMVLNLGIALANTGMNTATGNQSVNLIDIQQQSIAGAFWASLQSLFGGSGWLGLTGDASNAVTAQNTSDGAALVTTGDASATGLAATTNVNQQAAGSAAAGGQALLTQDASVTNAGLAIANTGGNDAAGLLALNAVIAGQWAGLGEYLTGYLTQLGTGAPTAAASTSSFALGDVLVDLFGEIHADEVLIDGFGALSGGQVEASIAQALGFADGFGDDIVGTGLGGAGPRIRVRQVTGTLTINLGIASTGDNTAETATVNVTVVDQESEAASEAQVSAALGQGVRAALQAVVEGQATGDAALDPANLAVLVNATTGAAVVATGDATAVNRTEIAVCQTFQVSPAVCSPPTETPVDPETPVPVPGVPTPAPPAGGTGATGTGSATGPYLGATPSGQLPRTGGDTVPLAEAGVLLVAAGTLLRLVAAGRRRRRADPVAGAGAEGGALA